MSASWIEVASFDLMQNVRKVRDLIGESVHLLAVVKGNAYGHGLDIASEAFWRAGIDGFVVTEPEDALFLIEKRYRVPILLLTPPESNDLWKLIQHNVRFAGVSVAFLRQIKSVAERYAKPAMVHLELETGMHRTGLTDGEVLEVMRDMVDGSQSLVIEGIFTHLHSSQNEDVSRQQLKQFSDSLFDMQRHGWPVPMAHVLSSEGITRYPESLFDGVRVGRALYGVRDGDFYTRSVLTWKTRLASVARVRRGETVGYGGTYTADRDRTIGVLPIGYYDGYDRAFANKGAVLVKGKRCPVIGNISMNHTVVDLSPVMHPGAGEEVVLLGSQGNATITPLEMAEWKGTIDYEILAGLPGHIPRRKVK